LGEDGKQPWDGPLSAKISTSRRKISMCIFPRILSRERFGVSRTPTGWLGGEWSGSTLVGLLPCASGRLPSQFERSCGSPQCRHDLSGVRDEETVEPWRILLLPACSPNYFQSAEAHIPAETRLPTNALETWNWIMHVSDPGDRRAVYSRYRLCRCSSSER
jgi:hypothetical protein